MKKVCKACSAEYEFPVHRALSTRFHCEDCATLDPRVRRVLERLSSHIRQLTSAVRALEKKDG